ncbi:glucosaminidase domain-containing protein [Clostridium estertheticum]|uniref:glucosaminidase domain-containing protein n=1 Tax=Clostridium estertheticum TaxID=238834 RepID=UPI00124F4550|nr:glucosaminidase domain-containing protein [Clostridium estertheticum]MBZ9618581.1 peptidoglycan-binding protein [Clostridium estertheticum subsp. laramiense]WAG76418.1 peptidoglycan-binding protein [Clostridium estertheticum]
MLCSLIPGDLLSYEKYNIEDSILDHGRILSFSRYKSVITSKNYKVACQNVYNSGYCSDKEYPEKLIAIIKQNKLYVYDCAPRSENTTDEDIKYLQKCLNSMKIKDINNNILVVDGASGPLTTGTIKKLQQILSLSIDGICGPEVLSGVKTIMEKPLCSTTIIYVNIYCSNELSTSLFCVIQILCEISLY